MVEAISKEVQNKVTTKGGKKPQSKAFADFINDLGKTSAPKKTNTLNNPKSAESTHLQAPINNAQKPNITQDLTKQDFIKKVDLKSDSAPKSEILSNLLKGKNEENLKDKTTQSPLDMILSRPQATQTKLNQTPQIKNSAEPQTTQNFTNTPPPRAREEAKLPQQNPQDLKDMAQDLPKNKVEIPLDSAPKSAQNFNIALENPQKSALDSAPKTTISNETKNQKNITLNDSKEPKNNIKDSLLSTNAQNDKEMLDSAPKAPKVESAQDFNPALENTQKDSASKIAENPQKSPLDSAKKTLLDSNPTQENVQKDSAPKIGSALDSAKSQDSTPNEAQNLPQNIKIPTENKSNLGIANTLKYGAFKAFDALSLLKPSDGKKLSDLIKKADELALNLQSIKYTKIGENKGVAGLDSTKQNLGDKAQNLAQKPENEAKMQANQMLDSALKQDFGQDSAKNENITKKIDEKNAESKNIELKNELKKEAPQTNNETKNNDLKNAESKNIEVKNEPKQAESKSAESPLKNALETENNDIKPINLKTEKIAESKKETPLDSIKDSAKDIKDAPKPTQENAPLTDAQGTSKITNKIFDARETMRHFAYALRQEIQNYKPPLSKITIELQPANLGSVEVSIISQGKNIQIQLHSNQNTLNLFIQNQSDLRTALSQIGYENVAMSFNNGAQMGFSDNSGKWRYESAQKSRNTFSLNDKSDEVDEIFEIMITNNYA